MKTFSSLLKQILRFILLLLKLIFWSIPFLFKGFKILIKYVYSFFTNFRKRVKRLFRFSITFKITVVYAFMLSFLLIILSTGILVGFRFYLLEQVNDNLEKASLIAADTIMNDLKIEDSKLNTIAERENVIIGIFDKDKNILYASIDEIEKIKFIGKLDQTQIIRETNSSVMILSREISINQETYYLQTEKNYHVQIISLKILAGILFAADGIGIIFILLLGSRISRRMLNPIEKMTDTVKAITIQDLSARLDISGSQDELRELAETFNEMINRIQESYERQNRFVSDASHELRTPISVIQGYVNLLDRWGKNDSKVLEESIIAIKDESENMKDLIEKLLFLARSDKARQKVEKQEFWLNELVEEVINETQLIDSRHHVKNEFNEKILFFGDRKLLKQTMRIFMDNSVKFTPEGGTIQLNTFLKKKHLLLVIEDTGVGIPKDDLPFIFDRFYRSDKSRTKQTGGYGLGLSIAKWIIERHDGRIEVQSTVQVGTKFTIYLPVSKVK